MKPSGPSAAIADRIESAAWAAAVPVVSVLVPTHDRAGFLPELVDALERQTLGESFELILIDDCSTDVTWPAARGACERTRLPMLAARLQANAGPAVARNVAASLARAPAFAFTDDDCLPHPGWLAALLDALRSADVVQGRTLPDPGEASNAGPWARSVWITKLSNLYETCNLAWRREAFDRLDGFAEPRPASVGETRRHFGEDAELGWRLVSSGGRVAFADEALVHHRVHPGSYASWLGEQRRLALFPGLVRSAPSMGRALTLGVFLSPDTALFDLALAGGAAAAALRVPWFAGAALPWAWRAWRRGRHRPGKPRIVRAAQIGVGDVVGFASLIAGSVRARRFVL